MSITFATYAAGTHDTFDVGSVRDMYNQLLYPHEEMAPTLRILLAYKQVGPLNPNEKFEVPVVVKDYSPSVSRKHDTYPLDDLDNVTSQEWGVVKMKTGAGTNDDDLAHFSNNELAYFNHVDMKIDSMHRGFIKVLNTLIFWDWTATDISSQQIDISTLLANQALPPEELYLKGVSGVTDAPWSLPMACRPATTGHTFGNIAVTTSTNNFWRPVITDADGATVERNTTTYNATSNPQTDVVSAISNPDPLDTNELFAHLAQVQQGKQYNLLAPVGRNIYMQLMDIVMSQNIRPFDSPIADLGIRSIITFDMFNTTFYYEPKMDALWPSTIFFFDPECYYLKVDEAFNPLGPAATGIYPWDRISGTTTWGTMIRQIYQMVCEDRRGVSAMYGYTKDA